MSLLDNLPHVIQLSHRTYAQDDAGGDVPSYAVYQSAWKCWVQQASPREVATYKYREMNVSHKIYILTDPGLQLDDRVMYGSIQLRLKAFRECTAGMNRAIAMMCDLDPE